MSKKTTNVGDIFDAVHTSTSSMAYRVHVYLACVHTLCIYGVYAYAKKGVLLNINLRR